jgi:hypothetical protein
VTLLRFALHLLAAFALAALAAACGPGYLDAAKKVPASDQNKQVYEVVKAYHAAVENKDVESLRKMISQRYYENGGTTDDATDDYGYDKCIQRVEMLVKNVKRAQLKIRLVDLQVTGDEAAVDYQYVGRALLSEGNVDAYRTYDSFSRMKLALESGHWMITGGL